MKKEKKIPPEIQKFLKIDYSQIPTRYPQKSYCLFYGDPVNKEQVWDIIKSTDKFLITPENNNSDIETKNFLKIPQVKEYLVYKNLNKYFEDCDLYRELNGMIPLKYLFNDWFGNNKKFKGWINPNGELYGGWVLPEPYILNKTIVIELEMIAAFFPFLNAKCFIFSAQKSKPSKLLVGYTLNQGEVFIIQPNPNKKDVLEEAQKFIPTIDNFNISLKDIKNMDFISVKSWYQLNNINTITEFL